VTYVSMSADTLDRRDPLTTSLGNPQTSTVHIDAVFTRPNTDHGDRLAVALGFAPIQQPQSEIWALPRSRMEGLVTGWPR